MKHLLTACTAIATSMAAHAHEGHGLAGIHWHASDFAGFGFVAVLAGFVIWLSRGE